MQENTEVTQMEQEVPEQVEEVEQTFEQKQAELKTLTEMKAKVYAQLVDAHIMSLTRVMLSTNKTSQLEKRQAESALREAVKFALDFGLGVTNAKIRDKGMVFAKETNNLAGVLVQALDNRMLLLASNMHEANMAAAEQEVETSEVVEETQTTEQEAQGE